MSLTKTRRAAGRSGTNSRKVGRNPTARQRQTPRFAAANCFVVFFVVWQCGLDDVDLYIQRQAGARFPRRRENPMGDDANDNAIWSGHHEGGDFPRGVQPHTRSFRELRRLDCDSGSICVQHFHY